MKSLQNQWSVFLSFKTIKLPPKISPEIWKFDQYLFWQKNLNSQVLNKNQTFANNIPSPHWWNRFSGPFLYHFKTIKSPPKISPEVWKFDHYLFWQKSKFTKLSCLWSITWADSKEIGWDYYFYRIVINCTTAESVLGLVWTLWRTCPSLSDALDAVTCSISCIWMFVLQFLQNVCFLKAILHFR